MDPGNETLPPDQLVDDRSSWMSKLLTVLAAVTALCGAAAVLWAVAGHMWIRPLGTEDLAGRDLGSVRTQVGAFGGAAFVAGALFVVLQWRFGRTIRRCFLNHAVTMDEQTGRSRILSLLMVSLLGLFLEVCLIRWHSTEFRAAAYFKNVSLLACFLGLGLGFAIAGRRRSYFPLTM